MAVAAVVAVVAPMAVLAQGGGTSAGPGPGDTPEATETSALADDWTSMTGQGVTVDLPPDWAALDRSSCDDPPGASAYFGPDGEGGCRAPVYAAMLTYPIDFDEPPGIQAGYVITADSVVQVQGVDESIARRILASARPEGTEAVDVSSWSPAVGPPGWSGDVPDGDIVRLESFPDYTILCEEPSIRAAVREKGGWRASVCDGHIVTVTAPTQALADVVASQLVGTGESPEVSWRQVTESGATFQVPPDWTSPPDCTGPGPAPAYGPGESDDGCREVGGVFVYFAGTFDPAYGPGVQRCVGRGWCGYRIVGDVAVFVGGVDRMTAGRLLDSVRPSG